MKNKNPFLEIATKCSVKPFDMEEIVLDRLGITSIEPDQLKLFPNLTVLYITHNKLKILNNLQPCIRLSFIDARNNQLSELDLKKQIFLRVLYLANNKFEYIENFMKQTSHLRNLEVLDLRGNEITQIKGYRAMMIDQFPNLETLDGIDITKSERIKNNVFQRSTTIQRKPQTMLEFLTSLPLSDADTVVSRRAGQIRVATELRLKKEEEERTKFARMQKEKFEALAHITRAPLPDSIGFKHEEKEEKNENHDEGKRRSRSRMYIKTSTFPEAAKDEGTKFFEYMNPKLPKIPTRACNEAVVYPK